MELKEKLQLLRTQMKLSQEELAEKLDISRQSVTKWENGQSFPDLQNLIQLSDLFQISIDRLVKEDDACNAGILEQQQLSQKELRAFLVRAKTHTYVTGDNASAPSKTHSKDFRYCEGDYTYMDTYLGSIWFAGEETVWVSEVPVYAMNYYGQILSEEFRIEFLKEALSLVTCEMPFRGPEYYRNGDFAYHCQVHGTFDCFYGEERIYCRQENVYSGRFHGGALK